jgi:hypothetical protein
MVIDDSTDVGTLNANRMTGCVSRDYSVQPAEMFARPDGIPLIPEHEWDARIKEQEERESSLEHLYLRAGWENLDQNGDGYCWAYSTVHAAMLRRAADNQPYVRLNPHAVAAIIKGGRDQGGWCGLSAQFLEEHGCPSEEFWPVHSRNIANDTPAMRANAALHKVTESWMDLQLPAYDRNLTRAQIVSCLLQNIPVALDFEWWGHSVCGARVIKGNDGYGWRILNSWKGWGRRGLGDIFGSKTQTMGAVGIGVVSASIN